MKVVCVSTIIKSNFEAANDLLILQIFSYRIHIFNLCFSERFSKMSPRHSLQDGRRIKARDDKLWIREKRRAELYNFTKIQYPCSVHKGTGSAFKLDEIERHLLRHGRSSECRTWRGPDDPDSSDDEWEQDFTNQIQATTSHTQPRDNGVQVRTILQHMYQEVDASIET